MIAIKSKFKKSGIINSKILKICLFAMMDSLAVALSFWFSVTVIYSNGNENLPMRIGSVPYYLITIIALTLIIFWGFRLYGSIWRYAGVEEALMIILASAASSLLYVFVVRLSGSKLEPGAYILYFTLLCALTAFSRFYYRVMRMLCRRGRERFGRRKGDRIMLIGAGAAGNMLLRQLQADYALSWKHVVCVIDDDPRKIGSAIHGVPVIGGRELIESAADDYNVGEIILAIPSVGPEDRSDILTRCGKTDCRLLILPNIYSILDCEAKLGELREVRIEDLLERDPIKLEDGIVRDYICGKRVMVTGGGGSIGSELCRQIALSDPALLIVLDIYENTAYELEVELRRDHPLLNMTVVIANIRERERIEHIFYLYKPETVFHAAAHKHVPLMEENPHEAVKNNIFGTLNLVRAAEASGTHKFVMISSDKAVRPTNVMGVTKRVCERIIQSYSRVSQTNFVAVRFGNVLGSHGSVVPLFREQIARGGPVRVTHPEITRYFMTIAEAVSLVLRAGAYARGGEIFVLDMGKPVRIIDLARNMIRLSGFDPDKDIRIEFTGLRPGEKLYEELLIDRQNMIKTENEMIFIEKPDSTDDAALCLGLDKLSVALNDEDSDIRRLLCEIVPEYDYSKNIEIDINMENVG